MQVHDTSDEKTDAEDEKHKHRCAPGGVKKRESMRTEGSVRMCSTESFKDIHSETEMEQRGTESAVRTGVS